MRAWSWEYLAVSGAVLILSGIAACIVALTVKLLPYDVTYLGMSAQQLCDLHGCRIVHFMVHDRLSFGGAIASVGVLYIWLASRPLARGETWAFWALVLSGAVGFLSFLSYLGFGYLDAWHGQATLLLLAVFLLGLARSADSLPRPRALRSLLEPAMQFGLRGRMALGRSLLLFTAAGMVLAGSAILVLGTTRVFVPEDLQFMQLEISDLRAVNARLVPLIAHDRAGFGGGLVSCGVALVATVWCAVRAGERELWWVLLVAGTTGFGAAIGAHPFVGYLIMSHLLPAVIGALSFAAGMALLSAPMRSSLRAFSK